ncbi:hypothetical protein BS78_07G119800 [Paspalum vaginatum]|nr:hypothetical protein BS78_07G119800 [Paspalum vaginatum]
MISPIRHGLPSIAAQAQLSASLPGHWMVRSGGHLRIKIKQMGSNPNPTPLFSLLETAAHPPGKALPTVLPIWRARSSIRDGKLPSVTSAGGWIGEACTA